MNVYTLKMCTGDAGPEQSLVLFLKNLAICVTEGLLMLPYLYSCYLFLNDLCLD